MQISLRSHITAGLAVAVVGAGTLAAAPVPGSAQLPSLAVPSAVEVALAAFDSPVSELLLTIGAINNNIFNGVDLYDSYRWEPYQGLLPEFIYTALPIISQLGFNGGNYIGGSIEALGTSIYLISEAVWQLPAAIVTAAGQAIGGNLPGALSTLINATVVPIQNAGSTALGALISVVSGVVTNLVNVVLTVPGIATSLVSTVIGAATALGGAVVNIATQTVGALATLNFEAAWNTVVDGLLGPVGADGQVTSSLPGTLIATTIGAGVGPLGYPNGYAVPSLRMWGEQSQLQLANAIGASYPVSAAAEAPSAASVRAAEATAVQGASAPASGAESSAAGDDDGSTAGTVAVTDASPAADAGDSEAADGAAAPEKPAKQRAVRSSGKR